MQVKKFEARTMKEALELVKTQLGPDAIILSARDIRKGYGLVGQNSVEITAAVSEESLRKIRFVEGRIRDKDRERLANSSSLSQKKVIEKFVSRYQSPVVPAPAPVPTSPRRYIDIADEPVGSVPQEIADTRIRSAAQRAWDAFQTTAASALASTNTTTASQGAQILLEKEIELKGLREELNEVKKMLADFQKVPQTLSQTLAHSYPGSKFGLPFEASATFDRLTNTGVQEELAGKILSEALQQMPPAKFKNKNLIDGWLAKYILDSTKIASLPQSGIQLFVGPAGLGKTSSLIKAAARLVLEGKKRVALVTCDTQKVGAAEQMKIYAQILNVPFATLRAPQDWPLLKQKLAGVDVVLVDFPARSLKTIEEISEMKQWVQAFGFSKNIHLVLSALGKTSDLLEIVKRFSVLPVSDLIFTGIDEATEFGNIFEVTQTYEHPILAFGMGSRVPEDFEIASKERMLDLIFKMTKLKKTEEQQHGKDN